MTLIERGRTSVSDGAAEPVRLASIFNRISFIATFIERETSDGKANRSAAAISGIAESQLRALGVKTEDQPSANIPKTTLDALRDIVRICVGQLQTIGPDTECLPIIEPPPTTLAALEVIGGHAERLLMTAPSHQQETQEILSLAARARELIL